MQPVQKEQETFEDIYPRYPFSELVRLGILLGKWIAKARLIGREHRGNFAKRQRPDGRRLGSL